MSKTRYHSLDSLRGIASLQVVMGHCFVAIPAFGWTVYEMKGTPVHDLKFYLAYSPLHFLLSATPAVFLFFVLSGFVLSLPYYSSESNNNYVRFFFKRILRLYIPCFSIIIISMLLRFLFYKENALAMFDSWIKHIWIEPITPRRLLNTFILNGDNDFDGALWTLPIEIKLSLLLPFFIYFHKNLNKYLSIIVVILFPFIYHYISRTVLFKVWPDLWNLYYFTFFLLGSLICKYKKTLIDWVDSFPAFIYYLVLAIFISVYTFQYTFWWLTDGFLLSLKKIEHYLFAISGAVFMLYAMSKRMQTLLNSSLFLFIGKISFSIYLIHEVVLITFAYMLSSYISIYAIVAIAFAISIVAATFFYKYIELPSSGLAKRASDYISGILLRNKKVNDAKQQA